MITPRTALPPGERYLRWPSVVSGVRGCKTPNPAGASAAQKQWVAAALHLTATATL